MDDQLSARRVRLRLEPLEDRLAPSISPAFDDVLVPDAATANQTATQTAPVVGVAADGSYVLAWQFNDTVHHDSDIFARRFNRDGTAKGAAFAVASSPLDETQPALAVAADGSFVVAYTKVVPVGTSTTHSVFFQTFDAAGNRKVAETEAPSHVNLTQPGLVNPNVLDDSSPDVAVSSATGQFVVVWVQQTGPNNRDVFARAFGADGHALNFNDVGVATTAGDEFNPHVAIKPSAANDFAGTLIPVISYTLDQGNGVQKVYFRRYASGLTPLDIGATGIAVSGGDTSAREDQSALVMDVSGNLLVAWTAAPPGGLSQVLFRQFNPQGGSPNPSPIPVDGNGLSQSAPGVALNGDGRFLVAYQGAAADGKTPAQSYYREFDATLKPVGASRPVSGKSAASNVAPRLGSSGSNFFVIVTEDLTGAHPDAVARGFAHLTSRVGVVRPTNAGLAQFSLDTNGDGTFDAGDSVFTFGFFSDQLVVGDWNGTGYHKIGVVRPFGPAAIFSLDTNGDGKFDAGDQVFVFGRASDQFLVGDWNGDGRSKVGVVRPNGSTATWSGRWTPTATASSTPATR